MRSPRVLLGLALTLLGAACGRSAFDSLSGGAPTPTGTTPSPTPTGTGTPDFGDGSAGGIVVSAANTALNVCHQIVSTAAASVVVDASTSFVAGRRVLLLQVADTFTTVDSANAVGDPGVAGGWELARVASLNGTTLTLAAPLARSYSSGSGKLAQVCTFPEYTSVVVTGSGSVVPAAWDGTTGGVVAFAANGGVALVGPVDASGVGFRGGARGGTSSNHVATWDTSTNDGGGKGEGVDTRASALWGRGCYRNAGGGGNARKGGAGGGGNGGTGGSGGLEEGNLANSGGGGGVALVGSSLQLYFGGGGGTAHQDGNGGAGKGGAGGGIVLIFASALSGAGGIASDGTAGTSSNSANGGGGGGGAGGTIALRLGDGSGYTGSVHAVGKNGGSLQDESGPGGGGAGGRIFLPAANAGAATVTGGANGLSNSGAARGATAGDPGLVVPGAI